MPTAAEILKHKHSRDVLIAGDASLMQAAQLMQAINIDYLVVMENDCLKGLFTEHDYLNQVTHRGWDPNNVKVEEAMTRDLPCVTVTDSMDKLLVTMSAHHVKYIPVFDGHHFEGVISADLLITDLAMPAAESSDRPN